MEEAHALIDQIEQNLHDLPALAARRVHETTHVLRAVSLAFEDRWLAAYAMAQVHMDRNEVSGRADAALTLYRMGLWKLMRKRTFQALSRRLPRKGCSRFEATAAAFDLSIEAAFAIDHLQLTTAKRLATTACGMFQSSHAAQDDAEQRLILLPFSLIAQVLYEQGDLAEAERIIGNSLPSIDDRGSIESALRCYLVLARIARARMHYDLAAILLNRGEVLGERRGWPRLVAACIAEKISMLLEIGRHDEARLCHNDFERYIRARGSEGVHINDETAHYRAIARCRLSWAEAPSELALASFRQLYRRAVEFGAPYAACRLATEYASMLASAGKTEEADTLFLSAVKRGASTGLYRTYLEGGEQTGAILERIYQCIDTSNSADRELLPFLGGLLFQWQTGLEHRHSAAASFLNGSALTRRELDILAGICQGLTNKNIGRTLQISPETVKSHVKRLFTKLGVGTRSEAVLKSKSLGLL